jgi:hypothetical protein
MSAPFQGAGEGGGRRFPGRCPGLVCVALAGQGACDQSVRSRVNRRAPDPPTPQPTAHSLDQPSPSRRSSLSPRQPKRIRRSDRVRPAGAVHTSPGFQPWVRGLPPTQHPVGVRHTATHTPPDVRVLSGGGEWGGTPFPRALPWAGMCCPCRAAGRDTVRRYRALPKTSPSPRERTRIHPPTPQPTAYSLDRSGAFRGPGPPRVNRSAFAGRTGSALQGRDIPAQGSNPGYRVYPTTQHPVGVRHTATHTPPYVRALSGSGGRGGTPFPRALPWAGMCGPFRAAGRDTVRRYRALPPTSPSPRERTRIHPPTPQPTAHSP